MISEYFNISKLLDDMDRFTEDDIKFLREDMAKVIFILANVSARLNNESFCSYEEAKKTINEIKID